MRYYALGAAGVVIVLALLFMWPSGDSAVKKPQGPADASTGPNDAGIADQTNILPDASQPDASDASEALDPEAAKLRQLILSGGTAETPDSGAAPTAGRSRSDTPDPERANIDGTEGAANVDTLDAPPSAALPEIAEQPEEVSEEISESQFRRVVNAWDVPKRCATRLGSRTTNATIRVRMAINEGGTATIVQNERVTSIDERAMLECVRAGLPTLRFPPKPHRSTVIRDATFVF